MAKKHEYTVKYFLCKENGEVLEFDSLTEKKEVFTKWSRRLSENMSRYFGQHPEEYEKL